jgi:hypothetical protein
MGSGELDGDQIETRAHKNLPRFDPPKVNTYILLGCYSEGVYSDGIDWI